MQETWVRSLDQEDALEKGMVTHSNILAWRIPWREEPGGLYTIERLTLLRMESLFPPVLWLLNLLPKDIGSLCTNTKQRQKKKIQRQSFGGEGKSCYISLPGKKESISGFTFHFTVNIFLFTQCVGIIQLILEFLSKGVAPCIVVRVVYPNGRGKLGASYATILVIPCTALYIPIIPQ